jgi:hypothetical protein
MTETIVAPVKTDKQIKFDTWLEELRSGDYVQADSALRSYDDGCIAYCCVGVLDEKVYGTQWHHDPSEYDADYYVYADDHGETTLMGEDRVEDMDLHLKITEDERNYFADIGQIIYGAANRIGVLATLNDEGHTFESIADYIEELQWNL